MTRDRRPADHFQAVEAFRAICWYLDRNELADVAEARRWYEGWLAAQIDIAVVFVESARAAA